MYGDNENSKALSDQVGHSHSRRAATRFGSTPCLCITTPCANNRARLVLDAMPLPGTCFEAGKKKKKMQSSPIFSVYVTPAVIFPLLPVSMCHIDQIFPVVLAITPPLRETTPQWETRQDSDNVRISLVTWEPLNITGPQELPRKMKKKEKRETIVTRGWFLTFVRNGGHQHVQTA